MESLFKKTRNYIIILIMFLMTFLCQAQEVFAISIYQDAKLLFIGDKIGNDALTPNILIRANMQGNQQKWGYMEIFPEFEYANLKGGEYQRYTANIGYVFNKLILDNFELGSSFGWGWINRNNFTYRSVSLSGVLNYKLSHKIKLSAQLQLTERKDLKTPVLRTSGFIGLQISII